MNNVSEIHKTKITDQIKKYKNKNEKLLSCLYSSKLFDFVENIPENWSKSHTRSAIFDPNMQDEKKSLPFKNFQNLLEHVNVLFFDEINKKLQNNEENSKITNIKFKDLDEVSNEDWMPIVEKYVSEVESLLRKISEDKIKYNDKVTMIMSKDFASLLKIKNKSNDNKFYHFAKFDNLLQKYNIQRVEHDFLNKSNQFTFSVPFEWYWKNKTINLNLKNNIIVLVITKDRDDFRFKIHNKIEFWWFKDLHGFEWRGVGTVINFDNKRTNLSKAEIFAIKS